MASLSYTNSHNIPSMITELRANFRQGISKDIIFRKEQLNNILRFLSENSVELKQAVWKDLRKNNLDCEIAEISPVVADCQYFIDNLDKLAKPEHTKKRYLMNAMDKTFIRKEAKGVVLIIGAWNYPINLLLLPLVGAIAAGNCVVLKPSELAVNTTEAIVRLLPKYIDQRIYRIVYGGPEQTRALLDNKLDHIFYTGGGAIGRIVMSAAARHLTPVTLELGGKSPVVVAADANIPITANRLVWGKFFNCGQTCVAPDYVLVADQVKEELIKEMTRAIREFYGENPEKSDAYGRIINNHQFGRLRALLETAKGDRIMCGGETDDTDRYIAPTIVYPVDAYTDELMDKELFGPIFPIVPIKSMDEAIEIINAKDSPLAMYVFTAKRETYEYLLDRTNSGGALINDTIMHLQELSLPFGGVGASGMGSYHGAKSFDTFTHERSTMVRSFAFESAISIRYPQHNKEKQTIMLALVNGLPSTMMAKVKTIKGFISAVWQLYLSKQRN